MKARALWLITGNGSYAFFQAMNSIVISKSLGLESLGYFSLALAMTAPIMLFSNFGLRILWVTDTTNSYSFNSFKRVRSYTSLVGLLFCVFFAFLYSDNLEVILVITLVGLSKLIENLAELNYAKLHKAKKQKNIAKSIFLRGALGFLGLSAGVLIFESLIFGVLLYSAAWFFVYVCYDIFYCANLVVIKDHGNILGYRKILKAGLPLAITMLLINANLALPRFLLSELANFELLGVYTALSLFVLIGSIVISSIGQVSLPTLAALYSEKKQRKHVLFVIKVLTLIISLSFLGACFYYFLGEIILAILFNAEVAKYNSYLVLMFMLAPLQYASNYMGSVISSTKNNISLVISQTTMFTFNIIFSYFFIKECGLLGAILAVASSSLVLLSCYFYFYYKSMVNINA